jgi:hypothetical protein
MTNQTTQTEPALRETTRGAQTRYVLITPARNEAAFIEETIKSVIAQTVQPLRWVIASDGSTDGTDDIVKRYAVVYPWIELVSVPERQERHFAAVGSLDADISFDAEYFSFLLGKMAEDPRLGLVGTPFREGNQSYDYRFVSIEHVSGACQFFRCRCFEEIGGYVPVKGGGIDHIAVITARMKGWRTRTFTEKYCEHHRKIGTAQHGALKAKFRIGKLDYALGGHPLWELFRSAYQLAKPPLIVGGLMMFAGYFWSMLCCAKRPVSPEFVKFRQGEQMARLARFLLRKPC